MTQVPKRKPKNTIDGIQVAREEFLKAKPLRHPESEWKKDEKGLHLKVPRKQNTFFRFFSNVLPLTRERRVLLDEQGAFIWSLCDGEHQIKDIAKRLSEQYNMLVSDAEAALDLYLVQLSKQSLIGFVLPESARERYHKRLDSKKKTDKKSTK